MSKNTSITSAFMELVKKMREDKHLTIEQLADLAGVHRTHIGLLERNERTPTLQVSSQIAKALKIPLSELIKEVELVNTGNRGVHGKDQSQRNRTPNPNSIRNSDKLENLVGLTDKMLIGAINSCYQLLDSIDEQLIEKGAPPIARTVELANLSSMVGNMLGAGISDNSEGLYERNRPHAYPDLLPLKAPAVDLELKMSLETNKPKGHLPKAGTYITFRYVLGDRQGNFTRGKDKRGDTVWIWEVKIGHVREQDFSCSNTAGDSGKTAVIKTDIFNAMPLVYYVPELLPYAPKKAGGYVGFN
jgi:transcriptional regulator with XRE-family HTH domain